mmetsp:Transcript_42078/g.116232  ORF Transcript_42078/g.116232 Transcript_42078/m.116232 type:complete len:612 (-) Transcript_42078:52-1887(-)
MPPCSIRSPSTVSAILLMALATASRSEVATCSTGTCMEYSAENALLFSTQTVLNKGKRKDPPPVGLDPPVHNAFAAAAVSWLYDQRETDLVNMLQMTVAVEDKITGVQRGYVMAARNFVDIAPWVCAALPASPTTAIGVPIAMFAGFLLASRWIRPTRFYARKRDPTASFQADNCFDVVRWTGVAAAFSYANFAVAAPVPEGFAWYFQGAAKRQCFWFAVYALGALASLPFFVRIQAMDARKALQVHGALTLLGNLVSIAGLWTASSLLMSIGRLVIGTAFPIVYTAEYSIVNLVPLRWRVQAVFINRACAFVGVGVATAAFAGCSSLFDTIPLQSSRPWMEIVPLFVMVIYAVIFSALVSLMFTRPLGEVLDENPIIALPCPPRESVAAAASLFSTTAITNFTRTYTRMIWQVGTIMLLSEKYCIMPCAGFTVMLVMGSLFFGRHAFVTLSGFVPIRQILMLAELIELCSILLLFDVAGNLSIDARLAAFLAASCVFYATNGSSSGLLLTMASAAPVPSVVFLNTSALCVYNYLSTLCALCLGPVVTYVLAATHMSQNILATVLFVTTLIQTVVNRCALRVGAEDASHPSDETNFSSDCKPKELWAHEVY